MASTRSRYSNRTVGIHWLSALFIFALIFTGISMEHEVLSEKKFLFYRIHFLLGNLVFILTIIRVIAFFKDPKPESLYPENSFREQFRKWVDKGFYVVILWMCISGILSLSLEGILPSLKSANWLDLPEISADGFHPIMLSHHIVAKFVFLLLIFHLSGYFMHLLQKRENTLKRIWFKP
ncbi:MAG: cytochrome b/b6 domain-containing protein [Saprospiraceae bacterium]|nr:cytochrome b/b6 domain-containing protein [Saprospiraceae bacterium]